MFFLARRERWPYRHTYYWSPIYRCPERWPLELMLRHLDPGRYKIIEKAAGTDGKRKEPT